MHREAVSSSTLPVHLVMQSSWTMMIMMMMMMMVMMMVIIMCGRGGGCVLTHGHSRTLSGQRGLLFSLRIEDCRRERSKYPFI
jgi:hypothetical protein